MKTRPCNFKQPHVPHEWWTALPSIGVLKKRRTTRGYWCRGILDRSKA